MLYAINGVVGKLYCQEIMPNGRHEYTSNIACASDIRLTFAEGNLETNKQTKHLRPLLEFWGTGESNHCYAGPLKKVSLQAPSRCCWCLAHISWAANPAQGANFSGNAWKVIPGIEWFMPWDWNILENNAGPLLLSGQLF